MVEAACASPGSAAMRWWYRRLGFFRLPNEVDVRRTYHYWRQFTAAATAATMSATVIAAVSVPDSCAVEKGHGAFSKGRLDGRMLARRLDGTPKAPVKDVILLSLILPLLHHALARPAAPAHAAQWRRKFAPQRADRPTPTRGGTRRGGNSQPVK